MLTEQPSTKVSMEDSFQNEIRVRRGWAKIDGDEVSVNLAYEYPDISGIKTWSSTLSEAGYSPNESFVIAKSEWDKYLSEFDLADLVTVLANQEEPISCDIRYLHLRALRRVGGVLVDAWSLFSQEHQAPPTLVKFVKLLGKFKDELDNPQARVALLPKLIKALNKYQNSPEVEFNPSNFEDFRKHMLAQVAEISLLLKSERLTLREYHELRKKVRGFNKYFYLKHQNAGDPQALQVFEFLHAVSGRMGEVQDALVELTQAGLVDRDANYIRVDFKHRWAIENFCEYVGSELEDDGDKFIDKFFEILANVDLPTLVEETYQFWQKEVNLDQVGQDVCLVKAAQNHKGPEFKAAIARLKLVRKATARLISIINITSAGSNFPPGLMKFYYKLGQLKDYKKEAKKRTEIGEDVLLCLDRVDQMSLEVLLASIKDLGEIRLYVESDIVAFAGTHVSMEAGAGRLESGTHHELRRRLRYIAQTLELIGSFFTDASVEAIKLHSQINPIVSKMGDRQHLSLVGREASSQIEVDSDELNRLI